MYGYEIKWKEKKTKPLKDWLETYLEAEYRVVDRENYLSFISSKDGRNRDKKFAFFDRM